MPCGLQGTVMGHTCGKQGSNLSAGSEVPQHHACHPVLLSLRWRYFRAREQQHRRHMLAGIQHQVRAHAMWVAGHCDGTHNVASRAATFLRDGTPGWHLRHLL